MSNKVNTVLYVGVTNNLIRRVFEHKNPIDRKGFTARYNVNKLVYYETTESIQTAIQREKQLKSGSRQAKIDLIQAMNPNWEDLYKAIID